MTSPQLPLDELRALNILILEDEPTDAERMISQLRRAGLNFIAKRTDTRTNFVEALEIFSPDVVLLDDKQPDFTGAEALSHVRRVHPEIPVVMVTDPSGEEVVVELLKAGAKDYVLKSNLMRLPFAVEQAISIEQGIRGRKAAEARLAISEMQYRRLFEAARDGILILDADTSRIVDINPYLVEMLGYDYEEYIGKTLWEIGLFHDIVRNKGSFTELWKTEYIHYEDLPLDTKDGGRRDVEFVSNSYMVGDRRVIQCNIRDITERKQAADTIREDEAKFRGLVEQNVAGVVMVRADGTLGYLNPYFAELYGYTQAEVIGRPLLDFVPEAETPRVREELQKQLSGTGGPIQIATALVAKDGRIVDILVSASPGRFEGQPASVAVAVDITEQKRAEQQLAAQAVLLATEHELSPDGILVVDNKAKIISVNRRFAEMFHVPDQLIADKADEPLLEWVTGQMANKAEFLRSVRHLYDHPEETARDEIVLRDGRVFDRHTAPMRYPTGEYRGRIWFFRDITDAKQSARTLLRLNRTLRTLSQGNEALVQADTEAKLLSGICRIIVDTGGYRMAWVGMAEQDAAKSVTPVAWAGEVSQPLEEARVTWADEPRGRGPHGRAIRSGEPQVVRDVATDPSSAPWRERAKESGFASVVAYPLKDASRVFGVLMINASETGGFDADELKLLHELAADLAFGIVSLRDRRAHEAMSQRWRDSLGDTVGAIANTVEMRDPYTNGHQQRVAKLAVAMARVLHLSEPQIEGLNLASVIHDVGKVNVPAEILNKPGKLSDIEMQLIRTHAQAGYDIIKGIDFPWPIAEMVRQHHERLDGSGYPRGLKEEAILPEAKILAVADVVEAMMSHRPYRPALGIEAALAEVENGKGTIYDPAAVEACTALMREGRFSFE